MKLDAMSARSSSIRAAGLLLAGLVAIAAVTAGACTSTAEKQRTFPSAADAVQAFVDALRADDGTALLAILGTRSGDLIDTGDSVQDKLARAAFVAEYDRKHELEMSTKGRAFLLVGERAWPFPIPVVDTPGGWLFDTDLGREEIINRRIGSNELSTIQTCLAVADAQREYYHEDHDGDGVLEHASRIISTPGKQDGLYWDTAPGEPPSPLGDLVGAATVEGYSAATGDERRPYHGYYFKILTSQGKSARGGAYDYMARGNMIGGFAVVACPSNYGVSGVMTFMINQDGVVYQKDLGKDSIAVAKQISSFDPDETWTKVPEADLSPALAEP